MTRSLTLAAGLAAAAQALPAQGQPVEIGNVAAANQAVIGTPPGATQRQLQLGFGVVTEERVETAAIGAGQFIFLDQTTLNVWPNSDIVLDRYVYDPDRGVGEMSVSMTRGVLRFIGGRISKTSDVSLRTPQGIVAVRGGIAHMSVTDGVTRATHIAGEFTRIGGLTLARENATAEMRTGPDGAVQVTYLGVLSPQQVAEMIGLPLGQGDGGADNPPNDDAAGAALASSGADQFGVAGADPNAPRVSTLGETERDTAADQGPEAPGFLDRQVSFTETTRKEENVTPTEPVEPPPPPPLLLPFNGGLFRLANADAYPGVTGPASRNLVIGPGGPARFVAFEEATGGVLAETAAGTASFVSNGIFEDFELIEDPDGNDEQSAQVIGEIRSFNVGFPGVFYLLAENTFFFDSIRFGEGSNNLTVFGAPTPPSFWSQVSGPDVLARGWEVSPDLFTGAENPFPVDGFVDDLADMPTQGIGLVLIPEPNAPLARPIGQGGGTKFVNAFVGIEGEGRVQRSLLGLFTARPELNAAGYPVTDGGFRMLGRDNDESTGIVRTIGYYTFLDAGGDGVTTYGDNAEFIVVGQGPTPPSAGAQDYGTVEPMFFGPGLGSGQPGRELGDTRLATFSESEAILASERFTLAAPRASTGFAGTANGALTHFYTGGYAVTATEFDVRDPYLLSTSNPGDVRMGFGAQAGAALAEFSNLEARGILPDGHVTGVSVNFGSTGNRSAFADDATFAARDSFTNAGGVTGQPIAASNRALRPDSDSGFGVQQQSFRGAMVSSELVDDFNPLTPEFLRWGWWSGELRSAPGEPIQTERMHLGAWVAGVVSDIADVNALSGSASYAGVAIASVQDVASGQPTAAYTQQGAFSMSYDFADRAGAIAISGILDDTFSGTISATEATGGNHYGGALIGTQQGGSGSVQGAFFSGGPAMEPALATGGRFDVSQGISIDSRRAVGVFAGDRVPGTGP